MDIELSDYVAGAYLVMKYADRTNNSKELLPHKIVSISECYGNGLHLFWTNPAYEQRVIEFGVPASQVEGLRKWCDTKRGVEIGYPNVFYSVDSARQFIREFLADVPDVVLIGIGLHQSLVNDFLDAAKQEKASLHKKRPRLEWYLDLDVPVGIDRVLTEGHMLAAEGTMLGFDLAVYEGYFSCSWLCGLLQHDMEDQFGARPNQYGLIDDFEVARKIQALWDVPASDTVWLLVQYPIE